LRWGCVSPPAPMFHVRIYWIDLHKILYWQTTLKVVGRI
jgi:hypothetical protein